MEEGVNVHYICHFNSSGGEGREAAKGLPYFILISMYGFCQ